MTETSCPRFLRATAASTTSLSAPPLEVSVEPEQAVKSKLTDTEVRVNESYPQWLFCGSTHGDERGRLVI